ncbi:hypothetical protein [Staphylococcus equorum]|uniref:Uncharacterized protein n=1 Tax=Staphylococcus equorum TaxID=246432 RepID=A0AAP7IF62_9STAP|nr:hypothetical protein [Staphylococcus equorum]OEK58960.1 hypothetical protein ASS94_01140 [Staphylococcus equorum]
MAEKVYYLQDKETYKVMLCESDKSVFIKSGIELCKKALRERLLDEKIQNKNDVELFEEIDLCNKVRYHLIDLEENNPRKVSDEVKLLRMIAEMLDIKLMVKN